MNSWNAWPGAGGDGLVTSGHEVGALHARWPRFNLVVPGVRPRWLTAAGTAPADDQRRTATPVSTLVAGASHVVIARPIITHSDPIQAVHLTEQEVANASRHQRKRIQPTTKEASWEIPH